MPDMSASVSVAMAHLVPLAEVDENKVTPGVLGFIVFAAMAVAVWALMKSMNRHMGKVDFKEPPGAEDTADREAGTAARTTGSSEAGPQRG
ncbi:hypothetical protein ACIP3D_19435 [Streptomyces longwoodensis]|nr:hypothetical protein [Streptomyces longwoodensis]